MRKVRSVIAVILMITMLFPFVGCSSSAAGTIADENKFFDALKSSSGISKEMTDYKTNCTFDGAEAECVITVQNGQNVYVYVRYKNAEDAVARFTSFYQSFESNRATKYGGKNANKTTKTGGSVIFNGEFAGGSEVQFAFSRYRKLEGNKKMLGAVIGKNNVYIEAFSVNGSDEDKQNIIAFFDAIGFKSFERDTVFANK